MTMQRLQKPVSIFLSFALLIASITACGVAPGFGAPDTAAQVRDLAAIKGLTGEIETETYEENGQNLTSSNLVDEATGEMVWVIETQGALTRYMMRTDEANPNAVIIETLDEGGVVLSSETLSEQSLENGELNTQILPWLAKKIAFRVARKVLRRVAPKVAKKLTCNALWNRADKWYPKSARKVPGWARTLICKALL